MAALFIASLAAVLALGYCGNLTVTEEVWFDFEVRDLDGPGEDYRGRVVIGLFGETCPMTAMNFAAIAKGFKRGRTGLHFKNTKVHRIVPDFLIQMGDTTTGDGTGGKSIYGDKFVDENFDISHRATGVVSMANHGKDTNGSQFFILLNKARWLDGKHVAFGKVIKGMDVIRVIGEVPADPSTAVPNLSDRIDVIRVIGEVPADSSTAVPNLSVRIVDSGINNLGAKYDLTPEQFDSEDDVSED